MEDKKIIALLNGIVKRDYYGDVDISNDFLKEQLFPDLSDDDFQSVLTQYEMILKNMIYSDMDLNQLEAFLTSLIRRKQNQISDEHKSAIVRFWKSNKQKLHSLIMKEASFNNSLKTFKWRIDLDYKDNSQASEPKVVFEIGLDKKDKFEKLVFESDSKTLDDMVDQVKTIEKALSDAAK